MKPQLCKIWQPIQSELRRKQLYYSALPGGEQLSEVCADAGKAETCCQDVLSLPFCFLSVFFSAIDNGAEIGLLSVTRLHWFLINFNLI